MVGMTIATKLVQQGHHVTMGSRNPENPAAAHWANANGVNASQGSFTDAAMLSEMILLCTRGEATLEVIHTVGRVAFGEKVVVDVSNPLDFTRGSPPPLLICNTDSLGEQVQKAIPYARVVKTLNVVSWEAMTDPGRAGHPTMLLCGNNAGAKTTAAAMLRDFGWIDILDMGDIKSARALEMLAPVWMAVCAATGHSLLGFRIVGR